MDRGLPSSLFINDGSFMKRFKQLQQEKEKQVSQEEPKTKQNHSQSLVSSSLAGKYIFDSRTSNCSKDTLTGSGSKLAFSLKQKSKAFTPSVKLGEDEEEDEYVAGDSSDDNSVKRQKLCQPETSNHPSKSVTVVPPSPSNPTVKNIADNLASFVAKKGRQIEYVTRQKNPGDTPFKFLFDESCSDYKYYEYRLQEEEKALAQAKNAQTAKKGDSSTASSQRSCKPRLNQTSSSALYDDSEVQSESVKSVGESCVPKDPIAMMEYYANKAAEEARRKPPKQSQDEMPHPASLQAPVKRGHHMGDFIPPEELSKFLTSCNDLAAQRAAKEAADRARIQADNIGHKLLSKMGWKEGKGVGGSRKGIADPIMAGGVKSKNLGVGACEPGEVTPDDDIYEQYKKRMMLGYRYRPNPLNNPRKAYY